MLIIALSSTSCKSTKIATTETNSTEHFREVTKKVTDSVFIRLHDSIFVKIKGDTVLIEKYHTDYRYLLKTDTLIKTDTIKVETIKIKEVNRITAWQQIRLKLFSWLLLICCCYGIYRLLKWYLKLKK